MLARREVPLLALTLRFMRKGQPLMHTLAPDGEPFDQRCKLFHGKNRQPPIEENRISYKDCDDEATKPKSNSICHQAGLARTVTP